MNLVQVKTFLHRHEAETAKGLLKEQGIEAVVLADDAGGYVPTASLGMGNVRLMVDAAYAANAKEVLKVLDTDVEGELWEEDATIENLPETKSLANDIKKTNKPLVWEIALAWLLVLILGAIYFLKQK